MCRFVPLVSSIVMSLLVAVAWGEKSPSGTLHVSTVPEGAAVSIGPRGISASPATFDNLAPGRYKVTVTKSGYLAASFVVSMRPEGRVSTNVVLTAVDSQVANKAPPEARVWLGEDLLGTYASLVIAVAKVPEGGRITLGPGIYRGPLRLDKPVVISGDGPREKVILESSGAACIVASSEGVVLRGITFRHRGEAARFALEITGGSAVVEDCSVQADAASAMGIHGVDTRLRIEGCEVRSLAGAGIVVFDGAGGAIKACRVTDAGMSGFEAHHARGLTIDGLHCTGSGAAGILVVGGRDLALTGCMISLSGHAGLEARGRSDLLLEHCSIEENEGGGVLVHEASQVALTGCILRRNTLSGLEVRDGGDATLRKCRIGSGLGAGVLTHHEGTVRLMDCQVARNMGAGAEVRDGGRLAVSACTISSGHRAGLVVRGGGMAVVRKSTISGQASNGVEVMAEARLQMLSTSSSSNRYYGALVQDGGQVVVRDCLMEGNLRGARRIEQGASWEESH